MLTFIHPNKYKDLVAEWANDYFVYELDTGVSVGEALCTTRHLPATADWSQWNLYQLSPHPTPGHNWLDQKWGV